MLPTDTESHPLLHSNGAVEPTAFAGLVLVAPFSSLPSLLLTYRIAGFFPLLLPFQPFPSFGNLLASRVADKWPTADRLAAYYSVFTESRTLDEARAKGTGNLQIIHAVDDGDISYHQTEKICRRVLGETQTCIDGSKGAATLDARASGKPRLRFEILQHGGAYLIG